MWSKLCFWRGWKRVGWITSFWLMAIVYKYTFVQIDKQLCILDYRYWMASIQFVQLNGCNPCFDLFSFFLFSYKYLEYLSLHVITKWHTQKNNNNTYPHVNSNETNLENETRPGWGLSTANFFNNTIDYSVQLCCYLFLWSFNMHTHTHTHTYKECSQLIGIVN